MFIRIKGL